VNKNIQQNILKNIDSRNGSLDEQPEIASDGKTINVYPDDNKSSHDMKFTLVKIGGRGVGINK
jgi:hypothetical protein